MARSGFIQTSGEMSVGIGVFHFSAGTYDRSNVESFGQLMLLPTPFAAPDKARDLLRREAGTEQVREGANDSSGIQHGVNAGLRVIPQEGAHVTRASVPLTPRDRHPHRTIVVLEVR